MQDLAKNKRVLIVCQHFWPESFRVNDIAKYFADEKELNVEVLCGLPNYPSGKLEDGYSFFKNRSQKYGSIKIKRALEITRGNNSNLRIFLNYISFPFFSLLHLPRLLLIKYDHIFLYQLSPVMMSITGIILGRIKKIPTTMYVLDLWPENLYSVINVKNKALRSILKKISIWHYKKTDRLIALSETMRLQLISITGKKPEDVIVIPQTCEKLYENEIKDPILVDRFKDNFKIVYTGNISPAQSFQTIIKAASKVTASGVENIHWVIVGDGMSKSETEKQVKLAGLSSYFTFEGQKPVEDIPKYTYIADAFIGSLVKSELLEATIPAKVVSYMASGKPLLLSMDGEVQDLINIKTQSGYASNTEDSETLAQNIIKLYNLLPKDRATMGKNAKSYYFDNFEKNIILTKMSEFIFNPKN